MDEALDRRLAALGNGSGYGGSRREIAVSRLHHVDHVLARWKSLRPKSQSHMCIAGHNVKVIDTQEEYGVTCKRK